jgi:hypothetical protein
MPSVSKKQHNFMRAIAHSPSFAKKVGVPQSVGKEFSKADKGKTFAKGGDMKESKAMVKKEVSFMKEKAAPKSMIKHEMEEGKMKRGGITKPMPTAKEMGTLNMKKGGAVPSKMGAVKTAKPSMGSASSRADGIAERGKTKGKLLKKGGMTC